MGITDLWKVIDCFANKDKSLSDIAVEQGFSVRPSVRNYNLGVDADIWLEEVQRVFRCRHARYGRSPELRTLLFRLMHLLTACCNVIFVFDGPGRPAIKRGVRVISREHWITKDFKQLIDAFGFDIHIAPGEAEAELAKMNQLGIIDAVLTEDSDVFVFGAQTVIRNSSYADPQHPVNMYTATAIAAGLRDEGPALTHKGLILVALLCGGDYDKGGLVGCGITTACGLARYGLGEKLCRGVGHLSGVRLGIFLSDWRAEIRLCLRDDPHGYVGRRNPALAANIPASFPDLKVLDRYLNPVVSDYDAERPDVRFRLPDINRITQLCELNFMWSREARGTDKYRNNLWPGVVSRLLINEALRRDGVDTDETFSDLFDITVERPPSGQRHGEARLNVKARTIEQVIRDAVVGLWTDEASRDRMEEDRRWVAIQACLQELHLEMSITRLMYPSKENRRVTVPTAVLLQARPQCQDVVEPSTSGSRRRRSQRLLADGMAGPSHARDGTPEVIDLTDDGEVIDLTADED